MPLDLPPRTGQLPAQERLAPSVSSMRPGNPRSCLIVRDHRLEGASAGHETPQVTCIVVCVFFWGAAQHFCQLLKGSHMPPNLGALASTLENGPSGPEGDKEVCLPSRVCPLVQTHSPCVILPDSD